jgi:hypothetical protein
MVSSIILYFYKITGAVKRGCLSHPDVKAPVIFFYIAYMEDKPGIDYRECIVGNIIGNHYWGVDKEIKSGTKHFRAGAKVYCVFIYGGMGDVEVRVLGKPRKAARMIDVVMYTRFIKDFRLQKVYNRRVIAFLDKHNWDLRMGEEATNNYLKQLNSNATAEIP